MANGAKIGAYNADDGFSGTITREGNSLKVTGTLIQQPDNVNDSLKFPKEEAKGYYLPIQLTGIKGQALKRTSNGKINVFGQTGDKRNVMNLIIAVDPENPTIEFKLYSTLEDAKSDTGGLPITIDCSSAEFSALLLHAAATPSAEQLQESIGEHTVADLIGDDYSVTQEKNTLKASGEIKAVPDLDSEFPSDAAVTSNYVPVILSGYQGNVLKYTSVASQEVKKTFGTDGVVSRSREASTSADMLLVIPMKADSPTQELKVYKDSSAAESDLDAQVFTVDASACKFDKVVYSPKDTAEFKKALTGKAQDDGNIHIELTQPVTLNEVLNFEKPAIVDLKTNKLTAANGITLKANSTIKNGSFDSTAPVAFITDATASPEVTLEDLVITHNPAKKHSSLALTQTMRLHTSTEINPKVTLKNCTITAKPASDSSQLQCLAIASIDNSTGAGELTLDNTKVTVTGKEKARLLMSVAPDAKIDVINGSVLTSDLDSLMILYNSNVTVEDSTINSPYFCIFASTDGNTILGKNSKVTFNNCTLTGTNTLPTAGENNIGGILFNGGDGNTVTIGDDTTITLTGGGTSANNEYLASFYKGKNNKVVVNGAVTPKSNTSKMLVTHSQTDGDPLFYDSRTDGDTIEISTAAAKKFYTILDADKVVNITEDAATAVKIATKAQKGDNQHKIVIKRGAEAPEAGQVQLPEGITLE